MYNQTLSKQRTHNSFVISLFLHLIAVLVVDINFPKWYQSAPPIPDPIVAKPIEVEILQPSYLPRLKNRISTTNTQSSNLAMHVPSVSQMQSRVRREQIDRGEQPFLMGSKPINTKVQLPKSDTLLTNQPQNESYLRELIGEPVKVSSRLSASHNLEIEPRLTQKKVVHSETGGEPQTVKHINRDAQIGSALQTIAGHIASGTSSSTSDIVFLLDTSGSMEENIPAVRNHLISMVKIFREKHIDFTIGIVKFKYNSLIFPQTRDYQKYERLLENVKCGGDERAYNAIVKSITRVKFRTEAERRFILITDEPCKGSYTISDVLKRCREAQIKLDVIGVNDTWQKYLVNQTGGLWFPIPGG
jgi:hypothetical protein